jgi:hypothetical protein
MLVWSDENCAFGQSRLGDNVGIIDFVFRNQVLAPKLLGNFADNPVADGDEVERAKPPNLD